MWEILNTTKSPAEEGQAILAIGATEDPLLIAETFERLLSETDGHVIWLLHGLSLHPKHRRPLLRFFKENYDTLYARFDTRFDSFSQLPFRTLATENDYNDTVAFFKTKDTSKFARSVEQTLESIQTNIKYLEHSTAEIADWFDAWEKRRRRT